MGFEKFQWVHEASWGFTEVFEVPGSLWLSFLRVWYVKGASKGVIWQQGSYWDSRGLQKKISYRRSQGVSEGFQCVSSCFRVFLGFHGTSEHFKKKLEVEFQKGLNTFQGVSVGFRANRRILETSENFMRSQRWSQERFNEVLRRFERFQWLQGVSNGFQRKFRGFQGLRTFKAFQRIISEYQWVSRSIRNYKRV